MRTHVDFTPYRRSSVGFDRLFDMLEMGSLTEDGYPPFDIERHGENSYRITLAVAGFRSEDVEIVAQQNELTVIGKCAEDKVEGKYVHRGIPPARSNGGFSSLILSKSAKQPSTTACSASR